jgi:hypothetical protein
MSRENADARCDAVIRGVQRVIEKDGSKPAASVVTTCLLMIAFKTLPPGDRMRLIDEVVDVCRETLRDYELMVEGDTGPLQ